MNANVMRTQINKIKSKIQIGQCLKLIKKSFSLFVNQM